MNNKIIMEVNEVPPELKEKLDRLKEKAKKLWREGKIPVVAVFLAVDRKGKVYRVKNTLTYFGRWKLENEKELEEAFESEVVKLIGRKERFIVEIRRLNDQVYFKEAVVRELKVVDVIDVY